MIDLLNDAQSSESDNFDINDLVKWVTHPIIHKAFFHQLKIAAYHPCLIVI